MAARPFHPVSTLVSSVVVGNGSRTTKPKSLRSSFPHPLNVQMLGVPLSGKNQGSRVWVKGAWTNGRRIGKGRWGRWNLGGLSRGPFTGLVGALQGPHAERDCCVTSQHILFVLSCQPTTTDQRPNASSESITRKKIKSQERLAVCVCNLHRNRT